MKVPFSRTVTYSLRITPAEIVRMAEVSGETGYTVSRRMPATVEKGDMSFDADVELFVSATCLWLAVPLRGQLVIGPRYELPPVLHEDYFVGCFEQFSEDIKDALDASLYLTV